MNDEWAFAKFSQGASVLNNSIRTDGYYMAKDIRGWMTDLYLFYDDGTCGMFRMEKDDSIGVPHISLSNNITRFNGNYWTCGGKCRIVNDTIEAYNYDYMMLTWYLDRWDFVILDNKTVRLVKRSCYDDKDTPENIYPEDILYHFVPANDIPDKDEVYCKRKKWLWHNEEDWKAYRQRMKQKRKEKKQQNKLNK